MAQSTSRNDSAGSLPGNPREGGGAPLSGQVVLLPRLKERDRIASALAGRGDGAAGRRDADGSG